MDCDVTWKWYEISGIGYEIRYEGFDTLHNRIFMVLVEDSLESTGC